MRRKISLMLILMIMPEVLAILNCDMASVEIQPVKRAFCVSARTSPQPYVQVKLQTSSTNAIKGVELVAFYKGKQHVFMLTDPYKDMPWLRSQTRAEPVKRTLDINPTRMGEAIWAQSFAVQLHFPGYNESCPTQWWLPDLTDCRTGLKLKTVGEGMGFSPPEQDIQTMSKQNATNATTAPVLKENTNLSVSVNVDHNDSVEKGDVTTQIAVEKNKLTAIFTLLVMLAGILGLMLVGGYLKERSEQKPDKRSQHPPKVHRHVDEEEETAQEPTHSTDDLLDKLS